MFIDSKPQFARRSEGNPVVLRPSQSQSNGERMSVSGPSTFLNVGGLPLLSSVLLIVLSAILLPASASAQMAHGDASAEFGPDGTSLSSFSSLNSLAYHQADDRLYVLAENGINGFNHPSAGVFTPLGGSFPIAVSASNWGTDIAVDNSGGASDNDIYYEPGTVEIQGFDSSGATLPGWPAESTNSVCGLAVDPGGNVWATRSFSELAEFAPGGSPLMTAPVAAAQGEPVCKGVVDPTSGDLYVGTEWSGRLIRLTSASGYTNSEAFGANVGYGPRLAYNGQRHVLYAGGPWGQQILAIDTTTDEVVEAIPAPEGAAGLAVDESTDTLFLATRNGQVQELPPILVPKPTTGPPTGTFEISGTADPDGAGPITECFFEYGTSTSYGSTQACEEATPILATEEVHATLTGLPGEQTYHYRLVLRNAEGVAKGADEAITPHPVKTIQTEPADQITRTTARLNASFEGTGEETTYYFEYGESSGYGNRIPSAPNEESAGVTSGPTQISLVLPGLKPETTYHFRVVATNGEGTSPGLDEEFTTPVAVDGVATGTATEIGKYAALLNGTFTGNGEAHTFYFEWGPSTAYGNATPVMSAGSGTGTVPVSAELTGLRQYLPDTPLYHYRLVVTNSTGSTVGLDRTFMTLPPDLPVVTQTATTELTVNGARLSAEINPRGGTTVYTFEYGRTTAYGQSTPLSDSIGEDETAHQVTESVTGLEPGVSYHFRVVAVNFSGTTHGPDVTFTTPRPPSPEPGTGGTVPVAQPPAPASEEPVGPKRCRRGFVKRHGKCVKRIKHHRHHHKRGRNG